MNTDWMDAEYICNPLLSYAVTLQSTFYDVFAILHMATISQKAAIMQGEISHTTKKILAVLCDYLKIKDLQGLAEYLGVKPSRIYSWVKYNKITDTGVILAKNPEINNEYLLYGKGNLLKNSLRDQNIVGDNNISVGGQISGSVVGHGSGVIEPRPEQVKKGKQILIDPDEIELILRIREVGGKAVIRRFNRELDEIEKLISGE